MKHCQTNQNNSLFSTSGLLFLGGLGVFQETTGIVIENHQSNGNTGNGSSIIAGISIVGAPGTRLLNSETSFNTASGQVPGTDFLGQGFVFGVLGAFATSIHMKGHTSNYNVSTGVGDELGGESFGVVIGKTPNPPRRSKPDIDNNELFWLV